MKLLINICAQDGIISHNSGVGTMVSRYIDSFIKICKDNKINYQMNLITPEYNIDGFGYSECRKNYNENMDNISIYPVSNGTYGKKFFGKNENWEILCHNAARIINSINFNNYDYVITLANDTPFAKLLKIANKSDNHYLVWIPHSTTKIHCNNFSKDDYDRIDWENDIVSYINKTKNVYMGIIGKFVKNHLIKEYGLDKKKCIDIYNGEILTRDNEYDLNEKTKEVFEKMKLNDEIVLAFGRPEKYKNLDSVMRLGMLLKKQTIVITQEYFPGMPYVNYLKELANETNSLLYINAPFNLPQYILNNYQGKIILLVPSLKEVAGLVVNEIRKMNKENVLLIANDINGIKEMINDGVDGTLVNLDNLEESKEKIVNCFNKEYMEKVRKGAIKRLKKDYDFEKNIRKFLESLIGKYYE